ncbi:hypothetical protein BLS_005422 [Venturia inaequalis]|uniref:Small ribosomal subunit protein mS23 n=1 Tax=Venturia inaequalis TaxID=5025 RepID=A0A8H3UHH3_VENIN|nr:hypothetical protein BLS_005422 [Venturia inaequalis]
MGIVEDAPPSGTLSRPVFRDARTVSDEFRSRTKFGRASKGYPRLSSNLQDRNMKQIFKPMKMGYNEDKLRSDFFNDHPWELARPKVILEDSGNDFKNWDWSRGIKQPGKRLDGESVIKRQLHLMANPPPSLARTNKRGVPYISKSHAYDIARKEFYFHRHLEDVERRIAKEEAMHVGAWFGPGPLEISMQLENKIFNNWKTWALEQVELDNQRSASQYTGTELDELEAVAATNEGLPLEDLDPSLLNEEEAGGDKSATRGA